MDDIDAIRLAKTELREAYRAGSVSRVLAVFGDGFADMSTGRPSFYGPEAKAVLGYRLKKLFPRYRTRLAVTIISIRIQGPLAFDSGWHTLTLVPRKGGRPLVMRTRYLEIWHKDSGGKWEIRIFLDNVDVPPRMPPREVLAALGNKRSTGHTGQGKRKSRA